MTKDALLAIKQSTTSFHPLKSQLAILTTDNIVIRKIGKIDPLNISEAIATDAYFSLQEVLSLNNPTNVIEQIKFSGLRGRGGGGFPTGKKWEFARNSPSGQKYVVCNADEGDPGAFMDRAILEGDPHTVLEAMAIAGFCIGASLGIIYVRAEYPQAVSTLKVAIAQAQELGVLGKNLFGSGFDFDIEIKLGAGAFVCGEETALIASVEGKRGEPRPRPPYPASKGINNQPTLINNVETYANITYILQHGAQNFSSIGTEHSKGTKVFAISGSCVHAGLAEVPMGTSLHHVVYNIAGGIEHGRAFKAAQTGGPSGGCIPAHMDSISLDYESLASIGSIMGSGGLIIMDDQTCMVDMAKFFLDFTVDESCGKCTPCRVGNKRLHEILVRISEGNGKQEDIAELKTLSYYIKQNSLCGLGQSSPNPVLSMLLHFEDEFIEHIAKQHCRAGKCKKLLKVIILPDKCVGCSACARICPTNAISGQVGKKYIIDQSKCIKCMACINACRFGAIVTQ